MGFFKKYLFNLITFFAQEESQINQIDAQLSDGTFGSRINNFFQEVSCNLDTYDFNSPQKILADLADLFYHIVQGEFAVLFATLLINFAELTVNENYTPKSICINLYRSTLFLQNKYKIKINEKSFFDVLLPLSEWVSNHYDEPVDWILNGCLKKVTAILKKLQMIRSKIGLSRYLGKRAIGLYDSGALFIYFLLKIFQQTWSEVALEKNQS